MDEVAPGEADARRGACDGRGVGPGYGSHRSFALWLDGRPDEGEMQVRQSQAQRGDDHERHRPVSGRHEDEADEEVGDRRAPEDESHVQGDADRRQDPAGDHESVDGPERQAVERVLDGAGSVEGEQEDGHEADDEQ